MLFEYDYEEQAYLIDLQHFDGEKDLIEVFQILSGDDPDNAEEYEIKVYRKDGDALIAIKDHRTPESITR